VAPIIQLKDVSTGYPNNPVFAHLDLTIEEGQFAGIIGPTGCGKTTVLKTILGSLKPHGGSIEIMGQSITRLPPGNLGYVPQLETVDWTFPVTVEQVIRMGLFTRRTFLPWPTREEKSKVAALAERLGIQQYLHHHIRDLSGGQQQRAFLARALINDPRILVLDEPTSGVDIKTQHDVMHLLGDLNRSGISIVLTTHDLNAAASHIPWIVCFNNAIIAQGTPADVFNNRVMSATYGGDLVIVEHDGHTLIAHKALTRGHHH
jgi:zinc/manganese transport system ATP-binding protein/zinc transport system ATP-binding protein